MSQELKIAMLGPRGVGKTSLLTAMYEQFETTIGRTNLQLTPDLESAAILQERLGELKGLLENEDFEAKGDIEVKGGIQGDETPRSFIFDLGKKGAKPSLRLHFQDYPGGYLVAKSTPEQKKFVENLLAESVAVLIAIDAPALMEKDGKWHDAINRPQQITDLFKTVYQSPSPRLVIFAPVRCEKYLKDAKSTNDLLKRVKDGYANLLKLFNSDALFSSVATVVTPVQTLGSVVFNNIEVIDNTPHFHFRATSYNPKYSPQDSEQPLRYLLRFLLKIQFENRGILGFVRDWFGWDEYLKQAARQAANGCKSINGFAVLQGEKLLNIE